MKYIKSIVSWLLTHKKISIPALIALLILIFILRPKPPVPIATYTVKAQTLTQTVSVSGAVNAKNFVNLTFPIGGTLSWVGVKKGDSVSAYQTIATLDSRTTQKNLQAALINYSEQRNAFDQTIINNNNIQNPQDALNDTMKRLLQNNQYDLNKTINSVELVDLARQQSILTTPIAGVVTRVDAPVGGVTAIAGSTTFSIIDPQSIVFDMDVDEADIGKITDGQVARITLDAYPNTTLSLPIKNIDFISHTTSNGGNAYTVEVQLPENMSIQYRVGMNGNADIITAEKIHVLTIPLSSVENDQYIYVKKATNAFVRQKVSLGLQSDTDAEVLSGIHAGDTIALDPTAIQKK